jgi:hypothetical protein
VLSHWFVRRGLSRAEARKKERQHNQRSHRSSERSLPPLLCRRSHGCAHHQSPKKEKGVPGSAEGRGDDNCILSFVRVFTSCELRLARVPSPSEAGAEEAESRERARPTRPWALASGWTGLGQEKSNVREREGPAGLRPQLGHQLRWIGPRERVKEIFLLLYFLKSN